MKNISYIATMYDNRPIIVIGLKHINSLTKIKIKNFLQLEASWRIIENTQFINYIVYKKKTF